jgi:hypothetical protein
MPWPRDEQTVIADRRLPESWLEVSDRTGEDIVRPTARKYLPQPVTVDVYGEERPAAGGIEAAFIPAPFRFCLSCGVSYEQVRGRDFAKLASLDQEGRSSATSLISASIVRSLMSVPADDLDRQARKLLTFVDNRQDASLQAGHFNDFVQVTMLPEPRSHAVGSLTYSAAGSPVPALHPRHVLTARRTAQDRPSRRLLAGLPQQSRRRSFARGGHRAWRRWGSTRPERVR